MQPEVAKRWREDCGQRLRLFYLSSPHPWAARALSKGKEPGVRTGHSGPRNFCILTFTFRKPGNTVLKIHSGKTKIWKLLNMGSLA
ncbi:hypothetical protein DBR06_SOUSAS7710038 [Sousa chinensis]|nr:hypothetical protein DBR06_SOUSAS7710038 [Sousa chinensis]